MELQHIHGLIDAFNASSIGVLEFSDAAGTLRLTRASFDPRPPSSPATTPTNKPRVITSAVIGIYRDANPPTSVGRRVARGEVLCTVEAMGLRNDVRAQASGEIKQVLCRDGAPIEYGETLFIIE